MKLKKLLSILCVMAMFVGMTSVVSADDGTGNILSINNDDSNFSELMFVEDGTVYLPLRLIFPNLNDKTNKIGFKIDWDINNPGVVHLIYGQTTGEGFIVNEDGTTTVPFTGTRKCVDIFLSGDGETGMTADLSVVDYAKLADGRRVTSKIDDSYTLSDKLYLKPVAGGDRLFASVEDIITLSNILGIDKTDDYKVQLY